MLNTKFITLIVLTAVIGAVLFSASISKPTLEEVFNTWKVTHNIGSSYSTEENLYRMKVF